MKALVGFLWIVVIVGSGVALLRRERRFGEVQNHGHPVIDNLLLLGSAVFVIAVMFLMIRWSESKHSNSPLLGRYVWRSVVIAVAAGGTSLSNRLLQHRKR